MKLLSKERKFKSLCTSGEVLQALQKHLYLLPPTPVGTCTSNISRSNINCPRKINDQVSRKKTLDPQRKHRMRQWLIKISLIYDITWPSVWPDRDDYFNQILIPNTKPVRVPQNTAARIDSSRFSPATISFLHLSNPTHALKLSSGVQLQKHSLNTPDSESCTFLSILTASLKRNENISHSISHITLKYMCDPHFSQETTILRNKNQFLCVYILRA